MTRVGRGLRVASDHALMTGFPMLGALRASFVSRARPSKIIEGQSRRKPNVKVFLIASQFASVGPRIRLTKMAENRKRV